jgi:tetratricopeptide (TPR) repeat protein
MEGGNMNIAMQNKWLTYLVYLPKFLLVIMGLLLLCMIGFFYQWQLALSDHRAYQDKTLLQRELDDSKPLHALQQAYLLSQQKQTSNTIKQMMHALTLAEAAEDINVRAQAKFAMGNLYFDLSAISGDIKAGGSHQQAVAQIELAREAYKSAIRLNPQMYVARFNLELLDRLSPEKRTQAWLAETDGVTLQPFKRNGTAMMKDNTRRGLP